MDLKEALAIREQIAPLSIYERRDLAGIMMSDETFTKSGFVPRKSKDGQTKGYTILPVAEILAVVHRVHGLCGIKIDFGAIYYRTSVPVVVRIDGKEEKIVPLEYTGIKTLKGPMFDTQTITACVDFKMTGKDEDDCMSGTITIESRASDDKTNNMLYTNAERTLYRLMYAIDGAEDPETVNEGAQVVFDEPAKADPFFSKRPKNLPASESPAPSKAETAAKKVTVRPKAESPAKAAADPTAPAPLKETDRRAIMQQCISLARANTHCHTAFSSAIKRNGEDMDCWTDLVLSETLGMLQDIAKTDEEVDA